MLPRVLISGCSGGGKSTLVAALAQRGYATVAEPGRRIIEEERRTGGGALPWCDMAAFTVRACHMARQDLAKAKDVGGPVFFDRGLIDAAAARRFVTGEHLSGLLAGAQPYTSVILAPPWKEIFATDDMRRHGFDDAVAEYHRIETALKELGYAPLILPRTPVAARVSFVLSSIGVE